jgi:hypothetical protein
MMQSVYAHNARSVFPLNERKPLPGGVLEIVRGIFHSVRPTEGRMTINIDITSAVM